MKKIEVGDRVRILKSKDYHLTSKEGMTGVVTDIIHRGGGWIQYELGFGKINTDGEYEDWERADREDLELII